MYMAYTTNPNLPKVRRDAVNLVKYRGWSMRKVARHIGVEPSTISRWSKRSQGTGWVPIPTQSSRPHHHPDEIEEAIIAKVIEYRLKYKRCAKVIHYLLQRDGISISLSSVERIFRRKKLVEHPYTRTPHKYPPRPLPERPGILIEVDTIVDGPHTDRLYVYTLIDVCSRIAFAAPAFHANTFNSIKFLEKAVREIPFEIKTIQSDHGAEFSRRFTERLLRRGFSHRHSRIRTPTDNGHLERFNRTIQEECLNRVPRDLKLYKREIGEYLHYYNHERPHMALDMKTPMEVLRSY